MQNHLSIAAILNCLLTEAHRSSEAGAVPGRWSGCFKRQGEPREWVSCSNNELKERKTLAGWNFLVSLTQGTILVD